MARRNKNQHSMDVWPGFVDAISTLLLLFVFIMALFSVISFSLGQSLSGKNEEISTLESELDDAASQADAFEDQVWQFETKISGLSEDLQKAKIEQDELLRQLGELIGLRQEESIQNQEKSSQLNSQIVALEATRNKLLNDVVNLKSQQETNISVLNDKEAQLKAAEGQIGILSQQIQEQETNTKLSQEELNNRIVVLTQEVNEQQGAIELKSQAQIDAEAEIITLREQIGTLSSTLQNVENALSVRDNQIEAQQIEISTLGNRINEALTSEVNRLQEYRSEFFGNLRQSLGRNDDVKIEGDRFVISSGVLFNSASAQLEREGIQSVDHLAGIINNIAKKIPSDINWVIRVDGHTDNIPYSGNQYRDNWELSNARALSVVHQLINQGVAPERLIAAGFGEFHPINSGNAPKDLAQNRRIEIKLTQK